VCQGQAEMMHLYALESQSVGWKQT
jgi:hypothetical protein